MISGPVFRRFLLDRRRGFLGWSAGIVLQTVFLAATFPTIRGQSELDDMIANLPENLKTMMGLDSSLSLGSALGYLDSRWFSALGPVLLLIYAIGLGARAIAGAEDDGLLELPAAHPVGRGELAGARLAALLLLVAGLSAVAVVSVIAIGPSVELLAGVSLTNLAAVGLAVFLMAAAHGVLAFTLGATGARRATAIGVPTGLAVVGWLAEGAGTSTAVRLIQWVTPWHWYVEARALVHGLTWQAVLLPIGISIFMAAIGLRSFDTRDLR